MQIIAGTAGGIHLEVPKGDKVRPTSGRTRTALFNSLGSFDGCSVVDLFAGAGSLGLEAASRGAQSVLLVEKDRRHAACIERNIEKVVKGGCGAQCSVICADVTRIIGSLAGRTGGADIVFADPPYPVSEEMFSIVTSSEEFADFCSGRLVWEIPDHCDDKTLFLTPELWAVEAIRSFGRTEFIYYRPVKTG